MFRVELEKILTNIAFYLSIVAVIVLLLATSIYKDTITGEEYSLIQIVLNDNKEEIINQGDLHRLDVINTGVGGYLDMFLPIIVAVPFVIVICGEKKNSNTRFEIYRVGKNRFLIGKFLASVVSGGLVLLIGYIIFSIVVAFILPGGMATITELKYGYFVDEGSFYKWFYNSFGVFGMMIMKFIRMFLYGAASSVMAFGLSLFIKNRYIIISIPFMFFYLFQKFVTKRLDVNLYKALISNIGDVFYASYINLLVIYGGGTLLALILCRIYLGRKCDCGEE